MGSFATHVVVVSALEHIPKSGKVQHRGWGQGALVALFVDDNNCEIIGNASPAISNAALRAMQGFGTTKKVILNAYTALVRFSGNKSNLGKMDKESLCAAIIKAMTEMQQSGIVQCCRCRVLESVTCYLRISSDRAAAVLKAMTSFPTLTGIQRSGDRILLDLASASPEVCEEFASVGAVRAAVKSMAACSSSVEVPKTVASLLLLLWALAESRWAGSLAEIDEAKTLIP